MEVHKKNHLFYLISFFFILHYLLFFIFFYFTLFFSILFHFVLFYFILFHFFLLIKLFFIFFFEKNISYPDKFNFFRIEMTNFVCHKSILFKLIAFKYSRRLHFYTIFISFHFILFLFVFRTKRISCLWPIVDSES